MICIADHGWFPDLNAAISNGVVKVFGSRREAEKRARVFGWSSKVLKVERRFETVHVIGEVGEERELVGHAKYQVLRLPLISGKTVLRLRRTPGRHSNQEE